MRMLGSFICSCKAAYSGNGFNCHGRLLLIKKVEAEGKKAGKRKKEKRKEKKGKKSHDRTRKMVVTVQC